MPRKPRIPRPALPRKRTLALGAAAAVGLPLALATPALSHGYTTSPPSRSSLCATGQVTGCGEIQWEPQSVEGPKGFPGSGPADGKICAAGDSRWAPLDDPRGGQWPATAVSGGSSFTISWKLTAVHATTSFRYFLTRDGWNPSQPLTRAALDSQPFLSQSYGGQRPSSTVSHTGTLPAKHGRHLLLAVWDIADTGNAFYSCADVNFG
ncbi:MULTISPECIES: lytic polysaccharide monooxygenase auxiliary activity family 9 protein [Thermomonosporaceae]|uniref:lytic polysaccharide monooxygenase auxiliary activity family 9 protein n=1 Tax=Thermomonosporaceae TaxID=2012 RepID=UPI00255B3B63|nr:MULTISPECIES: lytic polysaccharide monooxygenase auxiliary activity family 9 protein [Thermomonosporaceae]MDL4775170.1 lytic polysaccharide monooxygenase [Actinomadura xylanilytica]